MTPAVAGILNTECAPGCEAGNRVDGGDRRSWQGCARFDDTRDVRRAVRRLRQRGLAPRGEAHAWRSVRKPLAAATAWSYGGSGSAQLEVRCLLSVLDERTVERFYYQRFRWRVSRRWRRGGWTTPTLLLPGVNCGTDAFTASLWRSGEVAPRYAELRIDRYSSTVGTRRCLDTDLPATSHAGTRQIEASAAEDAVQVRLHSDQELLD